MTALLELRQVSKTFHFGGLLSRRRLDAVQDVSFAISAERPEIFTIIGESGSGKTTLAHTVMRGLDPTGGNVIFNDAQRGAVDVASAGREMLHHVRRNMQMVFQDPYASLNPRMTVLDIIGEPLEVNGIAKGKALQERVAELLQLVGLRPETMRRYPHAFSGGQRQRIVIARALALNPRLVIADEPTSALDVSIQAQTLNLLKDLQARLNLSYLFISHDLGVVEHVSDVVAVMYVGRLVEVAPTRKLYQKPNHPYTEALLSSIPRPDPNRVKRRVTIKGEIPNPANPPTGCHFHPRCPYAQAVCATDVPPLREIAPGQFASCHFSEVLTLRGVNDL